LKKKNLRQSHLLLPIPREVVVPKADPTTTSENPDDSYAHRASSAPTIPDKLAYPFLRDSFFDLWSLQAKHVHIFKS